MKTKLLATTLFVGVSGGLWAGAAVAQDAGEDPVAVTTADGEETSVQERVVVTGTRITNPNLEQASQIQVIGEEEITLRQVNTVEELIRDLPGIVPSIGPAVNNGNNGTQTINLRGIGSQRNLVLVNGRRLVPANLGSVTDTNNIPVGLIERVDVVTGGASTVYGADAVSGLTNFVTKTDFEGVEFQGSYRTTEEGDGEVFRGEILLGANFDDGRGNAVFSIGYQDQDGVLQGDREIGADNISSTTGNAGGSINSAPTVISAAGFPSSQFNPDTGAFETGFVPFNFNPQNLFQTPTERFNIYTAANYDLTPDIEIFGDAFFTRSIVQQQIASSAVFGLPTPIPIGNPFLPDPARDQFCSIGGLSDAECLAADAVTDPTDPDFRAVTVTFRRRFVEAGPRQQLFETNAFQFAGGLRGDVLNWNWELYGSYGESTLVNTASGFGLFSRVQQGLNAVDETTCVDPSNGCVPLNFFGPIGSLTPESIAFLDADAVTTTDTNLGVVQFNVAGDLGDVIKSPFAAERIGVAAGFEYRTTGADTAGDFLSQQPGELLGAGGADPSITGSFDVAEGYLETILPLVEDLPFVKNLTVEAGVRVSDYSTSGTSTTWKAGGSYEPVSGVRLRSIYQRAVRSPNIGELFSPVQNALGNFEADPCAGPEAATNAALGAICAAQGAPAASLGSISLPAAGQVSIVTGGNPDLDVESADTLTAGFVITPPQVPNLIVSIDYFNISIDDAISSPSEGDVISGCFDPAFNPTLAFNASCSLITRNALDGSLNTDPSVLGGIALQTSNLGTINTDGIDIGLAYSRDFDQYGQFDYRFNSTWTFENRLQATPASIDRDCIGFFSTNCGNLQPNFQFNQRFTYNYDIYTASVQHRFIGATQVEPIANISSTGGTVFLEDFSEIDAFNYVDLTLQANLFDRATLSLTIDNLFDKNAPLVGNNIGSTAFNSGNTFPTVFDVLGRTYTFGLNVRF